ncbi:MAG TPA: site-specific integrase [Burkholderiales bacterium]|nr:site-specific integrase [Burkholderiales bacterium]
MTAPAHILRRGTTYYFRRKIPSHLRAQVGKEEIRKSLGTTDLNEAKARASVEAAKLDQEFARLRIERFTQRQRSGSKPQALQISELFTRWKGQRERPRTTVYDFAKAAQRFAALFPDLQVSMVEPHHMATFRDSVLAEGVSAGTVRKQFGALSAMLELAVNDALLPDNPARGLRLAAQAGNPQKRAPFSGAELRAIFSTPIYRIGERPHGGAGPAAYWLPLLALYTGARLGELGALQVKDLREESGVKYLRLLTEHARATHLIRRVPIHGDLLRLGFMQFVEMQRRSGQHALFDELRADNKGKLTGNWSKWFARYLRTVARVENPLKSFDSFRPNFVATCARADIASDLVDALVGRAIHSRTEIPLTQLSTAIQSLSFDIGSQ